MHNSAGSDPFGSPDGKYVVHISRTGGEVVRILLASNPGEESTIAFGLVLDFSMIDEETSAVYSDFAFLQTSASDYMGDSVDRYMTIIVSGTERKVEIIDVSIESPEISIVTMKNDTELTEWRNCP